MKRTFILAAVIVAVAACKKDPEPTPTGEFTCDMSDNKIGENGLAYHMYESNWDTDTSNGYSSLASFKDADNKEGLVILQFNHIPKPGDMFSLVNVSEYFDRFDSSGNFAYMSSRIHNRTVYTKVSGSKVKVMAKGDSLDICFNMVTMETAGTSGDQSTISGHYGLPNW